MQILHTFKEHEHKRTLSKKKKLGNWDQKEIKTKKKEKQEKRKKPTAKPQIQQNKKHNPKQNNLN